MTEHEEDVVNNRYAFCFFVDNGIVRSGVRVKIEGERKLFTVYKGYIEYFEIPEKLYQSRALAERSMN